MILEVFAASCGSFEEIMHKLWGKFSGQIEGVAMKQDGNSSGTVISFQQRSRRKHETTVILFIYEYGLGMPNARVYKEGLKECVQPSGTDRSGATAESSLHEIVEKLQDVWGRTYQGTSATWRMWATATTQNLSPSPLVYFYAVANRLHGLPIDASKLSTLVAKTVDPVEAVQDFGIPLVEAVKDSTVYKSVNTTYPELEVLKKELQLQSILFGLDINVLSTIE
ncbi:Hypothetical protein PHPALM_20010 [Phytophthora palmivora]|uniref:Uncharacterized protein n=1 Tax=Phytophthora palmivora TaxID=4796 RepID=A0A2P4XFZ9_9STRA|nr:Hypothetical protein PHPALM_20010 [Phytophthora palmivora]